MEAVARKHTSSAFFTVAIFEARRNRCVLLGPARAEHSVIHRGSPLHHHVRPELSRVCKNTAKEAARPRHSAQDLCPLHLLIWSLLSLQLDQMRWAMSRMSSSGSW
jgi:hypothetical protein